MMESLILCNEDLGVGKYGKIYQKFVETPILVAIPWSALESQGLDCAGTLSIFFLRYSLKIYYGSGLYMNCTVSSITKLILDIRFHVFSVSHRDA